MAGSNATSLMVAPHESAPQGSSPFGNGRGIESIDGVARRLWPTLLGMREEGAALTPTRARAASTMPRYAMWPLTQAPGGGGARLKCECTRWRWHTAAAVRQELSGEAARRVALKEQLQLGCMLVLGSAGPTLLCCPRAATRRCRSSPLRT